MSAKDEIVYQLYKRDVSLSWDYDSCDVFCRCDTPQDAERAREVAVEAGFPSAFVDEVPKCCDCDGTEYITIIEDVE